MLLNFFRQIEFLKKHKPIVGSGEREWERSLLLFQNTFQIKKGKKKKKTTTVTYLTDRNNIEQIKTAIANAGYDADDITADEEAYKKLPKCCKKPAVAEEKKDAPKPN